MSACTTSLAAYSRSSTTPISRFVKALPVLFSLEAQRRLLAPIRLGFPLMHAESENLDVSARVQLGTRIESFSVSSSMEDSMQMLSAFPTVMRSFLPKAKRTLSRSAKTGDRQL
jgi:hypothetical protein